MAICYDVAPVGRYLKYRNQLSQNRMAEAAGKPILRIFLYIHIIVIMVIIVIVYHHAKTRVSVKFPLMKPNEALFFFLLAEYQRQTMQRRDPQSTRDSL